MVHASIMCEELDNHEKQTAELGKQAMPIIVNLDVMLAKRKMRVSELAKQIGLTLPNLSILKTGKAKAIRFSTLEAICEVLKCQPGDLLEYVGEEKKTAKK